MDIAKRVVGYGRGLRTAAAIAATAYQLSKGRSFPKSKSVKKSYYKKKKRIYKKKGGKSRVAKLEKKVKSLTQESNDQRTVLKYRSRATGSILASSDSVTHNADHGFSYDQLATALSRLQYFDASTGNWVSTAVGTGFGLRSYRMAYFGSELCFKNNYQTPVKVTVYLCRVRQDTSSDPVEYFNTHITKNMINTPSPVASANPLVMLSDSEVVDSAWNLKKIKVFNLDAGQNGSVFHTVKDVVFDKTSGSDLNYQSRFKNFVWYLRVEAGEKGIAHDAVDSIGYMRSGIDFMHKWKINVEYDGGAAGERVWVDYNRTMLDASAVLTSKPVADNITYSAT